MTIRDALSEGKKVLTGCETETPYLDASLLLADSCGISRERLYMNLSDELKADNLITFRAAMNRRTAGEPVAWILGYKEFWNLKILVGPGVLCPRPDSEILIESALEIMEEQGGSLHDCCTGPGTLALALAVERPAWNISASDISEEAAEYFQINNQILADSRITYIHTSLMEGVKGFFNIIVSNPPYLTPDEIEKRVTLGWKEPKLALDGGGNDGLNLIRRLIPVVSAHLTSKGAFLMEADPLQMPIIKQILSDTGFGRLRIRSDLAGLERIIIAYKG